MGLRSSLSPFLTECQREKAGNGCKGEGLFLPTTFVEGGATSHISHLIPWLCICRLSFLIFFLLFF